MTKPTLVARKVGTEPALSESQSKSLTSETPYTPPLSDELVLGDFDPGFSRAEMGEKELSGLRRGCSVLHQVPRPAGRERLLLWNPRKT